MLNWNTDVVLAYNYLIGAMPNNAVFVCIGAINNGQPLGVSGNKYPLG